MSPIVTAVIVFAVVVFMMTIQTVVSKLNAPLWGALIPVLLLGMALYSFFIVKTPVSVSNILVFALPFMWSLAEWYQGRTGRTAKADAQRKKQKQKERQT